MGPAGYRFAVSPLAELCAVLHVLAEPAHHREQREVISTAGDRLPAELVHELRRVDYLFRTSRADMFLPARPRPSLTEELDALDALEDEAWVAAALLTSSCGSIPLVKPAASPLTDTTARRIALDRAHARGARSARLAESILTDPPHARRQLRTLLEACESAFFAGLWESVGPRLHRDARHNRDLFRNTTPAPLTRISPRIGLSNNGSRLVVDKVQDGFTAAGAAGITFLPTIFGNPHLSVVYAPGYPPVIQYPVPASAPDLGPDAALVSRRLHALDNPIRFRLARSLARGRRTTLELAELWGLSSAEVSRHLAVLKQARLASSHRAGRRVVYTLDTTALRSLGRDLHAAFLR
jgi:DNA-binding transcriptional ArsR family regulator